MNKTEFQDPRPNSIRFFSNPENTEVLRISKDGIWANPDVSVDETAKLVLAAMDNMIKQMLSRAIDEDRKARGNP